MSKAKIIAGAGIIAAGAALSGLPEPNAAKAESPEQTAKEITVGAQPSALQIAELNAAAGHLPDNETVSVQNHAAVKRAAEKVYHRFEDIPAISDAEAFAYKRSEYTYIINADLYEKSGKIELKRVLADELTKANALSLVYRSECQTYNPKKNEDQLAKYVVDLRIMSKTGITKGPSQMDDNAVRSFIKYLAANPETRQYVLPLLTVSKGNVNDAARELEHKFFDENGDLRPMDERDAALHGQVYANLKLKTDAWSKIASPALKRFIASEEARMSKNTGKTITLSSTTKNYLCLTELFPSEEILKKQIEDYNLSFYQLGRPGKTKHVTAALARSLNLKDEHGNLDATRIPPFVIAAAISNINWKGNGKAALKDAQNLRKDINARPGEKNQILRNTVKNWVTGKSKRYGVDEMYELNIITPDIIRQYKELELSGARRLASDYQKAVEIAESKMRIAAHNNNRKDSMQAAAVPETRKQTPLEKGKTLFLSAVDFIRGR